MVMETPTVVVIADKPPFWKDGKTDRIIEVKITWKSGREEVYPSDFITKNTTLAPIRCVYVAGEDGKALVSIFRGTLSPRLLLCLSADLTKYLEEFRGQFPK